MNTYRTWDIDHNDYNKLVVYTIIVLFWKLIKTDTIF